MKPPYQLIIPPNLIGEHRTWSIGCFGNMDERGPVGPLKHMIKECGEAIEAIEEGGLDQRDQIRFAALVEEFGDIMFLMLDSMYRSGISGQMLIESMQAKMPVLQDRTYPKTADGVPSEHIREDGE
jgi:NTP pyrophosphatase (non-canonical NTP hydrolase)